MKIRNKIKNSKTLLFTSLVAVALLGATQPISASADEASNSIYNTYMEGYDYSAYYDAYMEGYKEGLSGEPIPDALDTWPSDYKIPYLEGYLKGKEEHNKSNDKVPFKGMGNSSNIYNTYMEGYDYYAYYDAYMEGYKEGLSGEPIPDALDTWPSDYKIPYLEGYLKGKEEHSKSNAEVPSGKNPHSQNEPRMPENNIPSPGKDTIPEPPHSEWPQRDPNFGGLSFGQSSDWGRSEDNLNSPSEPRIPGSSIPSPRLPQASENPKEDTSTLTYEKGLEDGRKAKLTNKIDYSRLSDRPDNPFPRDYVRGYFEGIK